MAFVPDQKQRPTPGFVPDGPKASDIGGTADTLGTIFGGSVIGEGLGANIAGLGRLFKGDVEGYKRIANEVPGPKQAIGDLGRIGTTVASAVMPAARTFLGAAGQFGALGAASGASNALVQDKPAADVTKETIKSAAITAPIGGVFNLLGRGLSAAAKKTGPSLLEFTSGAPKKAIVQAAENPATATEGLKLPVSEILARAEGAHSQLMRTLSDEFETGLGQITKTSGKTKTGMVYNQQGFVKSGNEMRRLLTNYGRDYAREFRIGSRMTPAGATLDFSKSPIVQPGQQRNVQEVFNTISTWGDFSPRGLQDLAERVGALRNFESGARTESSAIISKLYNRIAGTGNARNALIPTYAPELAKLRTKYADTRKVLDTISDVLNASKNGPVSTQSAVSRLDNIFKENRDVYLNAIEELGKRSGIDILSLLAGGEFQQVLPNYVRGLGGGAALGVGTAFVSPWAILLSPLFSPRFAGRVARSSSVLSEATSRLSRFGATKTASQSNSQ